MVKRNGERNLLAYRFAHLLLPLQDIGNGMIAWKFDVTIEDDTLAKNCCDVCCILTWIRRKYKNKNLVMSVGFVDANVG